ncbi:TatD family hydrolase [Alteribacillus iranensis]|uniref:TatD DNase family protein n=1 Tax=Alteribacillus iranensis TaxID=930128 RepID=A0A1I2D2C8_9BACI|nr:TatD family hydrolase [Alteribacillus iranensis]SFE74707.1 TatD DNase family protein [Alteribacillus iranensis]
MIDSHIHLHLYDEVEARIEKWREYGVEKVVAVSSDLASSYRTLELKERFPDFILAGVGFHPEKPIPPRADIEEWKCLLHVERDNISCVGEIGLPHYELGTLPETLAHHAEVFKEYIAAARTYRLPVALHAVHDKAAVAYDILQEEAPRLPAHFHWLKAPTDVVKKMARAGYFISVTPEVCYRERDQRLAALIPDDQLLIETDGPWPFRGPFSGELTTPLLLKKVISFLAGQRKEERDSLRAQLAKNALRLYV